MQTAECLNHLSPYLFAQIDAKKAALAEQGIDVISLGIGDPDMPSLQTTNTLITQAQSNIDRLVQPICSTDSELPLIL